MSSEVLSQKRGSPRIPDMLFFPTYHTASRAKSLQSRLTLCRPMNP